MVFLLKSNEHKVLHIFPWMSVLLLQAVDDTHTDERSGAMIYDLIKKKKKSLALSCLSFLFQKLFQNAQLSASMCNLFICFWSLNVTVCLKSSGNHFSCYSSIRKHELEDGVSSRQWPFIFSHSTCCVHYVIQTKEIRCFCRFILNS